MKDHQSEKEFLYYLLDNASIVCRLVISKLDAITNELDRFSEKQTELIQLQQARSMLEEVLTETINQREKIDQVFQKEINSLEITLFVAIWKEIERIKKQIVEKTYQTIGQIFFSLQLGLQQLDESRKNSKINNQINELNYFMDQVIQSVRYFSYELYPLMLDDLGIVPTVKSYLAYLKENHFINEVYTVEGKLRRYDLHKELKVFRCFQHLDYVLFNYSSATLDKVTFKEINEFIQFDVSGRGEIDAIVQLAKMQEWYKKTKELNGMIDYTNELDRFLITVNFHKGWINNEKDND